MEDKEELEIRLADLKRQHRELDQEIDDVLAKGAFDQLRVQRLKKEKLSLRDQISKIEASLLPDIIA